MAAISIQERILRNISFEPFSGCWLWLGTCDRGGYARIEVRDPSTKSGYRALSAHRACYEAFVGEIPDGLDIDHKCRVRCCVNPAHLEPVTTRENVLRGIRAGAGVAIGSGVAANRRLANNRCPQGHEYDRQYSNGKKRFRYCAECFRIRTQTEEYRAKRRTGPATPKTRCKHGHEFTDANTRTDHRANGKPFRVCRICERNRHS